MTAWALSNPVRGRAAVDGTGRLMFNLNQLLRATTSGTTRVGVRTCRSTSVEKAISMNQYSCDLCNQPAVIHDTLSHGRVVNVRHLCRAHGMPIWRAALPQPGLSPEALIKDPAFLSLAAQFGKQLQRRGGKDPAV